MLHNLNRCLSRGCEILSLTESLQNQIALRALSSHLILQYLFVSAG